MNQVVSTRGIDGIRISARQIVRELGFMQKGLGGTDHSPSAVHTIIELGYGTIATAKDLGDMLHLEKSTVSRLVNGLETAGLIRVEPDPSDGRARLLALTPDGERLHGSLEAFGRRQISAALDGLEPGAVGEIEGGLSLFAKALAGDRGTHAPEIEVREGYRPGVIAAVTQLHASYYSENFGFGPVFERKVATELSAFMGRIDRPRNTILSAYRGADLVGSVSLDGEDLAGNAGHLRWFIVSPDARGLGVGRLLLGRAVDFMDRTGFDRTELWTFKGLEAARHLYEAHGFVLVHEAPGKRWGTEVVEQRFERVRGASALS